MLTPSRWFQTDSGDFNYLKKFRELIRNSNNVRLLNYYPIYPDTDHTGGLSYLIIDVGYNGTCLYKRENLYVDLKASDIILKSAYHYQLINKITANKCMDSIFITSGWSGIKTNDSRLSNIEEQGLLKVYVSKKTGKEKWIPMNCINKHEPFGFIDYWKVLTPETVPTGTGFNDIFILAAPCELCNQTFCGFLVNSEEQGKSLITYLKTEFAHKMVLYRKIKNHINKHCLSYLPYLPLDRDWDDEKVVEYLKLNSQEKQIIYG